MLPSPSREAEHGVPLQQLQDAHTRRRNDGAFDSDDSKAGGLPDSASARKRQDEKTGSEEATEHGESDEGTILLRRNSTQSDATVTALDTRDDNTVTDEEGLCGCSPGLHDDHIEGWKAFASDMNQHLRTLSSSRKQYDNIRMVSIRWLESDVELLPDHAEDLISVFGDVYGYNAGPAHILRNTELDIREIRLLLNVYLMNEAQAISSHEQDNLFVLHYAGHGGRTKSAPYEYFWQPESNAASHMQLKWKDIETNLSAMRCDLLFIFDCCYAAGMHGDDVDWHHRCELMCSAGFNELASAPGRSKRGNKHSFTSALANELKFRGDRPGHDVLYLSNYMKGRKMSNKYDLKPNPKYRRLSRIYHPSIFLESMKRRAGTRIDPSGTIQEQARAFDCLNDLRVIVSLRFTNPAESLLKEDFEQWFEHRPHNVAGIDLRVECHGWWNSNSSLAIVSMPVWLWDLLPANPAYCEVGVVRSGNLLKSMNDSPARPVLQNTLKWEDPTGKPTWPSVHNNSGQIPKEDRSTAIMSSAKTM